MKVGKSEVNGDDDDLQVQLFMKTHSVAHVTSVSVIITQFLVGLASLPSSWYIYRGQSSVGYPLIPHLIELFPSAMLMYYDILKGVAKPIEIGLDVFRCMAEVVYIITYMYFAVHNHRIRAIKLASILVVWLAACTIAPYIWSRGDLRIEIVIIIYTVGWLVAILGPLGHTRELITTQNLNMFPIVLTFFQTLDGIVYSILNVIGAVLGVVQIMLYLYFYIRQHGLPQLQETDIEMQQILPESDSDSDSELHVLPSPPAEQGLPQLEEADIETQEILPESDSDSDIELPLLSSPPVEPMASLPAEEVPVAEPMAPPRVEDVAPPPAPPMPEAIIFFLALAIVMTFGKLFLS
ncbi:PREDICTED: bidirectional sugar transporter NEC1-like [Erythranthe guttata]|uniref:bidirectional sugar transporter NEC1-like n=1 Tax=Erythranthe guttata TaxID=4155 RepID=UPI00064D7976|nr:PREDICTED: bidirectional sugar transporter NEC1-like [Erythranthe guttata]|eukprot:XP_012845784.1 PREDICTED: bidirectional sugar transporter NEC1-like [Erythranthe guttata]